MRRFEDSNVAPLFSRPFVIATPGKAFASGECVTQCKYLHVSLPNVCALKLLGHRDGLKVLRIDSVHLPNDFLEHLYLAISHYRELTPTVAARPLRATFHVP